MKKSVFLIASIGMVVLSACGGNSSLDSTSPSVSVDDILTPTIDVTSTAGYKYGRNIFDDYMAQNYEYGKAFDVSWNKGFMPSTGRSKMLVVPVLFSDTTKTDTEKEAMRSTMDKAFFGESDATGWESVRSYYYKSSYHQLYIEGEVSNCVTLPRTFAKYSAFKDSSEAITSVVNSVYKALFDTEGSQYYGKMSDFDSNKDGVVDSIYMVNEAPIDANFGWAFTTWYASGVKSYPIGVYSWSSIDFATRRPGYTTDKPDSHTYIHETGHILGLNDYYDSYNSTLSPAGGASMQDQNICDHESYSKYLWGWTSPKVVTDKNTESSISVELKPFESSGDCLLLSSEYNDTSLDEYILVDYYTPVGLNEADVKTKYESALGIDGSGLRIWHVDKRIYDSYVGTHNGKETIFYDPNESEDPNVAGGDIHTDTEVKDFYMEFSTNSSEDYSVDNFTTDPELEMLRAHEDSESSVATSKALFVEGDTFGAEGDKYADFEFYSTSTALDYDCTVADYTNSVKNKLPYSIKVESIGDTAKLTLTKLANLSFT